MEKKFYEAPELEVLEMKFEAALLADSDDFPDLGDGDMGAGSSDPV